MGLFEFLFEREDNPARETYWFDDERRQRRDINQQGRALDEVSTNVANAEHQIQQLKQAVHELSVTVRVLTQKLAMRGGIEMAELREALDAELTAPRHQRRAAEPVKVRCVRCDAEGMSNEMVQVGSDVWCRPCAKNP